jgi:siroheme decarboxylase
MQALDDLDKAILKLAQGDLPICASPYDEWAVKLGIQTAELLRRIAVLKESGFIRDFKAILRHRQAGIMANAMVVWAVEPGRVEEVGALLAGEAAVTHCYERPAFGVYNIFSMMHGHNEDELLDLVKRIAETIRVARYKVYWSKQELKKSSLQYY